ncbi:coiled-coil domain-containing protein 130 homolog [Atheta coriaria]|uniref:coiled-coil domain-containing protein 130 homolog n=1 Tax=Dalotia coriaria TaxID=877792 RepID=UPI0031F42446
MGERKGQNKYYPPDYDPKKGGLNKFLGVHALRERGRKAHLGIIIIRFEMPYNIWCEGCKNHIGMGVRYNAEKTKVGMYHTTPVYEFKMKCHLCDNHFRIKTDPANLDYEILEGARRQENRWDPTQNEQIVPETKETQKRLFDDSMYKLEHGSNDLSAAEAAKPRLVSLFNRNEDAWADCYTANQKLRASFRKKSKELKQSNSIDTDLLRKSSLNITLLPEDEDDRHMAAILSKKLTPVNNIEENTNLLRKSIISKSALPTSSFTPDKERKALRALSSTLIDKNIVKKKVSDDISMNSSNLEIVNVSQSVEKVNNEELPSKKQKLCQGLSLLGEYGSSSDTD